MSKKSQGKENMQRLMCVCKPQTCRGGRVLLGPQEMRAGRVQTGCVCSGGAGCLWRAPLQALIICSTISAAPRLCSRACWYRSLCFSISFSWGRARSMVPSESRLPSQLSPPSSPDPHPCVPCFSHWLIFSTHKPPLSFGTEIFHLFLAPRAGLGMVQS